MSTDALKFDPRAYRLLDEAIEDGWLSERCAQRIIQFYGRGISAEDVRTCLAIIKQANWENPEIENSEVLLFSKGVRGVEHGCLSRSDKLYEFRRIPSRKTEQEEQKNLPGTVVVLADCAPKEDLVEYQVRAMRVIEKLSLPRVKQFLRDYAP